MTNVANANKTQLELFKSPDAVCWTVGAPCACFDFIFFSAAAVLGAQKREIRHTLTPFADQREGNCSRSTGCHRVMLHMGHVHIFAAVAHDDDDD